MVAGLDKFKEAFRNFSDNYVIIGGTACDVVLRDTVMKPRATDDIDMILIIENMTPEFANAFWKFIKTGRYANGKRKRGEGQPSAYELYRFENPQEGYPIQIELLSRHSGLLGEPSGFYLEPIPVGADISSLSAIMMDNDYYELTVQRTFMDDGLRFASPIALICLKIKAYLNLLAERESGKQVNTKDIKKHRNDVLKLSATVSYIEPFVVPTPIFDAIQQYIELIHQSLPNQSLEAALNRSSEDIQIFLDVLSDLFTTNAE